MALKPGPSREAVDEVEPRITLVARMGMALSIRAIRRAQLKLTHQTGMTSLPVVELEGTFARFLGKRSKTRLATP